MPGGSANNYDYVNQDPLDLVDLTGRDYVSLGLGLLTNALNSLVHTAGKIITHKAKKCAVGALDAVGIDLGLRRAVKGTFLPKKVKPRAGLWGAATGCIGGMLGL